MASQKSEEKNRERKIGIMLSSIVQFRLFSHRSVGSISLVQLRFSIKHRCLASKLPPLLEHFFRAIISDHWFLHLLLINISMLFRFIVKTHSAKIWIKVIRIKSYCHVLSSFYRLSKCHCLVDNCQKLYLGVKFVKQSHILGIIHEGTLN